MPQFRADYDVQASLVLPSGTAPVLVRSESPAFEMTFRNADPDESGHVPNLVVVSLILSITWLLSSAA